MHGERRAEFLIPVRIKSAANLREHWAVKAKRVKWEREVTAFAMRQCAPWPYWIRASDGTHVHVQLTRIAPRELDGHDNLRHALKACADEIANRLGFENDRNARLRFDYGQEKGAVRQYGVRVCIVAVPAP